MRKASSALPLRASDDETAPLAMSRNDDLHETRDWHLRDVEFARDGGMLANVAEVGEATPRDRRVLSFDAADVPALLSGDSLDLARRSLSDPAARV